MKKILISFITFCIVASLALGASAIVFAADTTGPSPNTGVAAPGDAQSFFDKMMTGAGLSNFSNRYHELSSVDPGADIVTSAIFTVIDFVKYILGAIAIIYLIVSGIKLIASTTKVDEVSEKQKENLKYIIYAFVLVIIADELVTKVFFGDYGECIASASNAKACAVAGSSLIKGIYSFILAIMASVGLLVIIISAFRLVTSYGNDETITKEKKRIAMSAVALIVAGTGEFVIKKLIFREGGTKGIDVAGAQSLLYNFTNFIAAFIGVSAFVMLLYGGYMYVASFGNDEGTGKAKKVIISAIIGVLIALAAFAITTTLINFNSGREITVPTTIPGLGR